jgi:hypothetical protein
MQITLKIIYGPQVGNGNFSPMASFSGYAFNTDTLQVEEIGGTWHGAMLDTKPGDIWLADNEPVWWTCDLTGGKHTASMYRYNRGTNECPLTVEEDSIYCGFVPAETRTCRITITGVTVVDDTATVQTADVVGPLQYSLDGGATRQDSPLFEHLEGGSSYTATVFDLGAELPGCKSSLPFYVEEPDLTALPATVEDLPEFCFAGNPVLVQATATRPYRDVVIQVWVEDAHRSGQFSMIYAARKRSDGNARALLDVSDILAGQLEPELNDSPGWHVLTKPIRNWFVRAGDVVPALGLVRKFGTSNNSVVLLGGLPPEVVAAGLDYWSTALEARGFLTWQPRQKKVGPNHREVLQLLQRTETPWSMELRPRNATGAELDTAIYTWPEPEPADLVANLVAVPEPTEAQLVHLAQLVLVLDDFNDAHSLELVPIKEGSAARGLRLSIDRDGGAVPRQLTFQNSLAGFDTIPLFGRLASKLAADRNLVEVQLPMGPGQPAASAEMSWPPTAPSTTYSASTGWTTNDWTQYLQELLASGRKCYEVIGLSLRPVVILTKEIQPYQDGEGYAAAIIEYRASIRNNYYADYVNNTDRRPGAGFGW